MSHLTILTSGRAGAGFLAGVVEIRNEEEVHVVANVGSDFEAWGLHGSPDIDLVLNTLSGALDPYQAEAQASTSGCYDAMRRLGMAPTSTVTDLEVATCLLRTQFLNSGMDLAGATRQLAERFGIGVDLMPATNDPLRTTLHSVGGGVMRPEEYRSRRDGAPEVERIAYEGAETATVFDRVLDSILGAERVILAPGDPELDLGAFLALPDLRSALGRTRAGVVAISPIVGSQAVPATSVCSITESSMPWSVVRLAESLHGVVDTLVIHTTDLDRLDAVRGAGLDAWADNIVLHNREDARRLAGRVLHAGRMVARNR